MKFLELRIPPVALVVLFGFGMWLLSSLAPSLNFNFPGRRFAALLFACLGIVVGLAGITAFRSARTTVDPRVPERSSAIVSSGIYGWSRNPMYLGLLSILFGWSLYLANGLSVSCLALFVLYMERFQIRPEERAMLSGFGDEYRLYMKSVRRWL